jgi:hypothetical protein
MKERLFHFSTSFQLPDYLEDALEPFAWSGIFSRQLRDNIVSIIMAVDPVDAVRRFREALEPVYFLDSAFKRHLIEALERYAEERSK